MCRFSDTHFTHIATIQLQDVNKHRSVVRQNTCPRCIFWEYRDQPVFWSVSAAYSKTQRDTEIYGHIRKSRIPHGHDPKFRVVPFVRLAIILPVMVVAGAVKLIIP